MKGLTFTPMTKSSSHGTTRINIDAREFNRAMEKAQKDIAVAMQKATGEAFAYAKRLTENYIRGYAGAFPQAKRVANSLDYDKRDDRKAVIHGDDVTIEAKFGSRGPDIHNGILGGEGVLTQPDDTDGRYQIAVAFQEGIKAGTFPFNHKRGTRGTKGGAMVHGRQIGTMNGDSAWYGNGGVGYQYGYPKLDYLSEAKRYFSNRIRNAMKKEMDKRL